MKLQTTLPSSVLLVGCGRMGGALLAGWSEHVPVAVLDPIAAPISGIRWLSAASEIADLERPALVVLAVKPAHVIETAREIANVVVEGTVFLSVAAGIRIEAVRAGVGPNARVARAMPNIAVAKGAGATALCFDSALSELEQERCASLFRLVGEVVVLESEELLDVATALAGSGPAFFFRFGEALAASAVAQGMPTSSARALAEATLRGAGALCDGSAPLVNLRNAVTSPGGTTAAGLARLDTEGRIDALSLEAIEAAVTRARELGS